MNALSKYLLYRRLVKKLRSKSVAVKQVDTYFVSELSQIELGYDKYSIYSFKNGEEYWTHVNVAGENTIATFRDARAKKIYQAAYWLAIAQAPANELRAKMQIDRAAIDFACSEIGNMSQKTR